MADIKVQYVNYEIAMKNIKHLYEFSSNISMQSPVSIKDKQQFLARFKDLERYRQRLEESFSYLTANIDSLSKERHQEIEKSFNVCSDMFYSIQVFHSSLFESEPGSKSDSQIASSSNCEFHLPKISLTRFTGVHTEWPNFISIFNSLIHNNKKLSEIEKMHYLLSVLDREPLSLIKNLTISTENYEVAYKLLMERYENKRAIADKHVEAILNLPNLTQINFKSLNKFLSTIKENINALTALKFNVNSWSFLLVHIIVRKLCTDFRSKFESIINPLNIPTFDNLLEFLETQLRILENISSSSLHSKPSTHTFNITENKSRIINSNTTNYSCSCCNSNHSIYNCTKFNNMTPEQRKIFVIHHKLCFNCLRPHHISKCSSRSVCQVCHGHHHTKLHISNSSHADRAEPTSTPKGNEAAVSTTSTAVQLQSLHGADSASTMLLGTAFVGVQDVNGYTHSARALIDCGSQVSIISENLAQKLKLPRTQSSAIFGLGAASAQQTRGMVHCSVKSLTNSSNMLSSKFLILKRITNNLPSVPVNKSILNFCNNLVLADESFTTPGHIDILFGIDLYNQILDGRRFSLGEDMPTAYSSIFGWIIMGKAPAASLHTQGVMSMACTFDLNLALTRFWEMEEPPSQPIQDPEDVQCERHFCETHIRDATGRFIVRLPFKVDHKPLGDTRINALKRFHNLERRLHKDTRLRELYIDFMRDYLDAGHMREVSLLDTCDRYYIPHHGVLREHSSTTKLRAVFDASAPSSTGVSLNQVLMSGPKLQRNIEDIILRFRLHKFVFTCDIKQMYRQVRLDDSDCKYQTIFWRESPDTSLRQFELTTVTYGVSSSAFQAIRVIHELAHLNAAKFPKASQVLLNDTFVDDIVSGADCIDSVENLQRNLVSILAQGGFVLRKWSSNCQEFLNTLSIDHCELPYHFEHGGDNIFKVLGMAWNASNDSFTYRVTEMNQTMTMRGVLSNIARLYDPCGFLAPVTFYAKHIMQRLWSLTCSWDDPLPIDIHKTWVSFISDFNQLHNVSISRWVLTDQPRDIQIHGFSDASERGYAACVYLRVQYPSNQASAQLLLAKSRVAPLKQKITIPKLELCGALLLARLLEHVIKVFSDKLRISSMVAWCDSSIVLTWLKTSPHILQTYEGNRVSQIQALVPSLIWRYVPSSMNPADAASRGLYPSQLSENLLWWSPPWLEADSSTWPGDIPSLSEADLPGVKSTPLISNVAEVLEGFPVLLKFSSFPKLQAVVAWCKRFLHNSRYPSKRRTGSLSVPELNDSLKTIVYLVQSKEFSSSIKLLQGNKPLKDGLRRLNPFLDFQGLLRVGGRLTHSNISYDSKHPLLLPKSHHVTRILIDHYHRMFLHPGANTLFNLLQRSFWILSARQVIRQQIFQCQHCYKLRPKSIDPFMGDLPVHRVTSCRPFQKVGVDFAGPFLLKASRLRNARSVKAYLCIFICFTTKAVHLEVVSELSTDAFLACLDRFVSRRGLPSDIFSDCGTNFVGAHNYIKDITQLFKNSHDEIHQYLARQQIVWHFNAPASPHMGGLWERALRSAKQILSRIIGDRSLFYEELVTIFAKIEAVLNSRPLCPLNNDPNDLDVLTPGHFIIGQPLLALPEQDLEHKNVTLLKRWQLLRQITQHFWKRWQAEYLHTLQQRPKWLAKNSNFEVGDLVLIKDPNLPPLRWKRARVIRVCPGSDGIVRVVELKTSTGTLLRPVVKLCPLLPCLN